MKTKLFLVGLALIAIISIAIGQNTETENKQVNAPGKGVAYVDVNKNGICDNFENNSGKTQSTQGKGYIRGGNGNANCNGTGQGQGKGKNFVDANQNGICDTYESGTKK